MLRHMGMSSVLSVIVVYSLNQIAALPTSLEEYQPIYRKYKFLINKQNYIYYPVLREGLKLSHQAVEWAVESGSPHAGGYKCEN